MHIAEYMDTSNIAVFVNADQLHFNVGRRVRAVMQVVQSDGVAVIGKSMDEKQIVARGIGSPPPNPLTNFVEVIGIVNSDKSIRAEIWTNFGDAIGICILFPLLNMVVKLILRYDCETCEIVFIPYHCK